MRHNGTYERPGIEELHDMFSYDASTGVFTYKQDRANRRAGDRAGSQLGKVGYRRLCVNYKYVLEHHAAWAMTYGVWPEQIDHINRDRLDNSISNLREFTQPQNCRNMSGWKARKHDLPMGVSCLDRSLSKPYYARICHNRKKRTIGYYATAEEASAAYMAAKKELHPEFYIDSAHRA